MLKLRLTFVSMMCQAVLTKWYDPIKEHDAIVQDVEEKMAVSKALAKVRSANFVKRG